MQTGQTAVAVPYSELEKSGKLGVAQLLDKYKGFIAAVFLSTLTAALFLLRSGPLASGSCSNVILILCEMVKFAVSFAFVASKKDTARLFHSIPLAFVPVTCYVIVNLLTFWALKYVHASLGALMSQIKLPATAVISRVALGRQISMNRTMAVITIFCGSLAIAAYGQKEKEDGGDDDAYPDTTMFIYILATLALLGESCLSAGTGVFSQWVFKGRLDTLWVRNTQFAFLSILQYLVLEFILKDNSAPATCSRQLDSTGVIVGVLYAAMGLSVALTVLWLGAIEKTLASVSSVVLTQIGDHLFVLHEWPDFLELAIACIIINGIVHFSLAE